MSNETSLLPTGPETSLTLVIKLILFSVPLAPSLLCSLYIFMCCIYERSLRRRPNHIIISIIVIDFVELMCDLVPISLNYFATGHVYSLSLCCYWVTANYLLQGISSWLMAWVSIDRYLLIFSSRNKDTFLRHDGPILLICLFVTIWYIVLTFTFTCTKTLSHGTQFLCGGPCFNSNVAVETADWILIVLLPTFIIVLFTAVLLSRVLFQKCRRFTAFDNRSFTWRKNRKLLIQLSAIIIVYFVTQFPLSIFSIVRLLGPPHFLSNISLVWLYYTPYLIYIAVPFAYLATNKECRKRLSKSQHRVEPIVFKMQHRNMLTRNTPKT